MPGRDPSDDAHAQHPHASKLASMLGCACLLRRRMAQGCPMTFIKKDAGSHNECHQIQGTKKHSASHHPHPCLGREGASNWRHAKPSAHLHGYSLSIKPQTKQAAHASVTQGQLKLWLWYWTTAHKLAVICANSAKLGPLDQDFGCFHSSSVQALRLQCASLAQDSVRSGSASTLSVYLVLV